MYLSIFILFYCFNEWAQHCTWTLSSIVCFHVYFCSFIVKLNLSSLLKTVQILWFLPLNVNFIYCDFTLPELFSSIILLVDCRYSYFDMFDLLISLWPRYERLVCLICLRNIPQQCYHSMCLWRSYYGCANYHNIIVLGLYFYRWYKKTITLK